MMALVTKKTLLSCGCNTEEYLLEIQDVAGQFQGTMVYDLNSIAGDVPGIKHGLSFDPTWIELRCVCQYTAPSTYVFNTGVYAECKDADISTLSYRYGTASNGLKTIYLYLSTSTGGNTYYYVSLYLGRTHSIAD